MKMNIHDMTMWSCHIGDTQCLGYYPENELEDMLFSYTLI